MTQAIDMHVACPDRDTALAIARAAVERKLAACANIWGPLTSVFCWEGAVEEDTEQMLSLKSVETRATALCDLIGELHPYDLPAITWQRVEAEPGTLSWLEQETG
ncbi:divalent-cation tolerance protein CutA [Tranquillimonas alkanivorans]|uniref:Divalent cation tolerance protein n=1 Tax=Tranquillimonas alkanivorans TaxID=441119 RepID=A0A1I5TEB0_9RHOB|nr:divalent-cation tolerance protein CutA [Tranquillimonas alkanivorans]SFP81151.1 divalent cation tolerance protein [Tranquillimonas alkanivorans]